MQLYRSDLRRNRVTRPANLDPGFTPSQQELAEDDGEDPHSDDEDDEEILPEFEELLSDAHWTEIEDRCDGCGCEIGPRVAHSDEERVIRYCPGCELLRQQRGTEVGEHEQYRLREEGGD